MVHRVMKYEEIGTNVLYTYINIYYIIVSYSMADVTLVIYHLECSCCLHQRAYTFGFCMYWIRIHLILSENDIGIFFAMTCKHCTIFVWWILNIFELNETKKKKIANREIMTRVSIFIPKHEFSFGMTTSIHCPLIITFGWIHEKKSDRGSTDVDVHGRKPELFRSIFDWWSVNT